MISGAGLLRTPQSSLRAGEPVGPCPLLGCGVAEVDALAALPAPGIVCDVGTVCYTIRQWLRLRGNCHLNPIRISVLRVDRREERGHAKAGSRIVPDDGTIHVIERSWKTTGGASAGRLDDDHATALVVSTGKDADICWAPGEFRQVGCAIDALGWRTCLVRRRTRPGQTERGDLQEKVCRSP